MSAGTALLREWALVVRSRAVIVTWAAALVIVTLAVAAGWAEAARQQALIASLQAADAADRASVLDGAGDYGGAAYGSFHLTWDPPTPLAFAALGQRDVFPWVHRVRALALEGQIYEADTPNPMLALVGKLDFAFVVAYLLPLLVIVLLHDITAAERSAGRLDLLRTTAGSGFRLWAPRVAVRAGMLLLCVLLPFWAAAVAGGVGASGLLAVSAVVALQLALWVLLTLTVAFRPWEAATIGSVLLAVWLGTTLLAPVVGKEVIERSVPLVDGADILLTQREAVNDAWDLPKADTIQAFVARHPEWAAHAAVRQPFEWKWYFAFQQVGDQTAEPLAVAYREGVLARDRAIAALAWISPAVAVQRALQRLAGSDTASALAYEARVRAYHEQLRRFYYPHLFLDAPFDRAVLDSLPAFQADSGGALRRNRPLHARP